MGSETRKRGTLLPLSLYHADLLGWSVGIGCDMWPAFNTLNRVVLPALSRPRKIIFPDLRYNPKMSTKTYHKISSVPVIEFNFFFICYFDQMC